MKNDNITLTEAEWQVMECLWDASPLTGRETTDLLERKMGWNRSTTLTLLRRLEDKGAVGSDSEAGKKTFFPVLKREDAALRETENFLSRVYKGSLSLMVSAMTQKRSLSQQEVQELYALLHEMEEKDDA